MNNQEQPTPNPGPSAEEPAQETTTTTAPDQGAESPPATIGGQVIERNEDGTITETVFPVTEVPATEDQTAESEPVQASAPQPAETSDPSAEPSEPVVMLKDENFSMPEVKLEETQSIAEVKPDAPNSANHVDDLTPAAGLVAGAGLIAAAAKQRLTNRGKNG